MPSRTRIRLSIAGLTAFAALGTNVNAQVRPAIAPATTANCDLVDLYSPLEVRDKFHQSAGEWLKSNRLKDCIDDLRKALDLSVSAAKKAAEKKAAEKTAAEKTAEPAPCPDAAAQPPNTACQAQASAALPPALPVPAPAPKTVAHDACAATVSAACPPALQEPLLAYYLTYLKLKRWQLLDPLCVPQQTAQPNENGKCVPEEEKEHRAERLNAFNRLSEDLWKNMSEQGILRPFSAVLITGFSFTALGAQAAVPTTLAVPLKVDVSGLDSQSTQATGFLQWETRHFLAERQKGPDFSAAGTVGFRPTLTLVTLPDSSQKSGTTPPLATFQQAFAWDAGVNLYQRFADSGEHGVYFRYGQTMLTSINTLLGTGSQAAVGSPTQNMTGRAEGKVDLGYKVNLYGDSLDFVHVVKNSLSPIFSASGGFRYDSRFKGQGVLSDFHNPEWRLNYSVAIDTLQILKHDVAPTTASSFALTLRVDYERALPQHNSPYVPSATRVFVQGTTDIVKYFQGTK